LAMILNDIELARRLEEAETIAAEAFLRQLARRWPEAEVVVEVVAGGRVIFAGAGSPLTEAKAIGLHGPVTEADLDRLEAAFFSRGEPARVVVCPLADPSFVEGLGRRGYRLVGFENFLFLPLGRDDPERPATPGIEVRPIEPGEVELYARVVASNFVGPGESPDDALEMTATMLGTEHASAFLAYIDGEPVGGGAVLIQRGLALLAGAATLPPYRNLGVQAALHHARLNQSRRSGCDLAAQGAEPGSTSQRNAERRGFRVAYTRAILGREPA
jgi:GNAT superfamily N-acetyltransferase